MVVNLKTVLSEKVKRCVELAGEKGAGAWLSALPLQSLGYVLNKQEFRDSIYLRYGWMIPNTPAYCGCKSKNDINHTLNCKLGGYVTMRHNNIRDLEASLLREVCKDVKVEPELLPIGSVETQSSNKADKARLDVSAIGLWSSMEWMFLDVRVMHPNSASYADKTPHKLTVSTKKRRRKHIQRQDNACRQRILHTPYFLNNRWNES